MIVDGRSVTFTPTENHQIEFTIACIHQISRIPAKRMQLILSHLIISKNDLENRMNHEMFFAWDSRQRDANVIDILITS